MTKTTIDSTLLEQISKELDALKRRGVFGDFDGVADALKAAMAEPQDPDSWGAGYEAGYAAGVAEHPAQPVQEPDSGGKTGWPPGLLQDDCRGLSKWLASRPDARQRLREALAEQAQGTDCHAQGIRQRSGYCIVQRKPLTETSAERTLKRMGYTDCGGELWKPPLGAPDQPSLLPDAETAWRLWGEVQP